MGTELRINVVVPQAEFCHELSDVLRDAILVDDDMNMIFVSANLLERLEFAPEEIFGKSLNYLTREYNLKGVLQRNMLRGDSPELYVPFYTKCNMSVLMLVSGFQSAVVARSKDCYQIVKVSEVRHLERGSDDAETNRAELDHFIYRTAHDLRGPIATIRGLINLHRIRHDEFTPAQFVGLVGQYAEELDQKLCKLLYLAESGQQSTTPGFRIHVRDLERSLRASLESHALAGRMQLHIVAFNDEVDGIDEIQTFALLENLLLFILHLPQAPHDGNRIVVFISPSSEGLDVRIIVRGIEIDERLAMVIQHRPLAGYGQLLRHPELINYFAAQKIGLCVKASLRLKVPRENELEIRVWIPRSL